jgi:hypothetical protein
MQGDEIVVTIFSVKRDEIENERKKNRTARYSS